MVETRETIAHSFLQSPLVLVARMTGKTARGLMENGEGGDVCREGRISKREINVRVSSRSLLRNFGDRTSAETNWPLSRRFFKFKVNK